MTYSECPFTDQCYSGSRPKMDVIMERLFLGVCVPQGREGNSLCIIRDSYSQEGSYSCSMPLDPGTAAREAAGLMAYHHLGEEQFEGTDAV